MYGRRRIDGVDLFAGLIIGFSIIFIVGICIIAYINESECSKKGGEMVGTGEHSTIMMSAGDGVYMTMETENKECSK